MLEQMMEGYQEELRRPGVIPEKSKERRIASKDVSPAAPIGKSFCALSAPENKGSACPRSGKGAKVDYRSAWSAQKRYVSSCGTLPAGWKAATSLVDFVLRCCWRSGSIVIAKAVQGRDSARSAPLFEGR
jgi:hypothetical protein